MDENESLAKAMGYVHDAKQINADQVPQYKAGSNCANCMQLQGKDGEEWRPCSPLFAGKLVSLARLVQGVAGEGVATNVSFCVARRSG